MLLQFENLSDEEQLKRAEEVRVNAETSKKIMYLENHGSEDNLWDVNEMEPWNLKYFN